MHKEEEDGHHGRRGLRGHHGGQNRRDLTYLLTYLPSPAATSTPERVKALFTLVVVGLRPAVRHSVVRQLSEVQSPFQTGRALMRSRTAALWEEEALRVKNGRAVFKHSKL